MKTIPRELIRHLESHPQSAEEGTKGEVRVRVRLVNASDEGRYRRGEIPLEQVRQVITEAVVDTGAVPTVIPPQVMIGLVSCLRQNHGFGT
ncbi:MAG: hypothetical protein HZA54_13825, partial [Planctomycetes bacterium]|nr:hypothetical protein [Planctomycetota bacterium]